MAETDGAGAGIDVAAIQLAEAVAVSERLDATQGHAHHHVVDRPHQRQTGGIGQEGGERLGLEGSGQ